MCVCLFLIIILPFTRYKEEDIRDDHCQQICNQWLIMLGIKPHSTLTLYSAFTFFILAFTLAVWVYTYLQMKAGDSTEALHHICLSLLASGLFSIQFFKHAEILRVAKQIDDCFSFETKELKYFFRQRQRKLFTSWMKIYTDIFTITVFMTWGCILIKIYVEQLFVADIEPPAPMILPMKSKALYYFLYFTETFFVITACIADVMVAQLFMMFTLQLTANYEVLCLNLTSITKYSDYSSEMVPDSKINAALRVIIKHHQEIFKALNSLKHLFDQIFYILYFSMMSAIAMCRTLLVGDIDIKQLLPLFYLETGYIHIFCHFFDSIIKESANVGFSAYSTPWYDFSSNIGTSIRIIMLRAWKNPKMYFFIGGSDVSLATFSVIMNASMSYFFISFMMGNRN